MNGQQLELLNLNKRMIRKAVGDLVKAGRQYQAHHGNEKPPVWLETWAVADKEEESKGGPLVEELLKHVMTRPPHANPNPHHNTPPITSQLIAQIKTLPQLSNKAFFIAKDEDGNLAESVGLAGVAKFYGVFTVNMTRYRKGKMTSNVFELRHWPGFALTNSHTKCLIGSFAAACLNSFRVPHLLVPKSGADEPSYRPLQIFFETKDDADDPQVQLFLTMMGMESSHLQVISPKMLALFEEHMDAVIDAAGKKAFPKALFPHMSDMCQGIACGNCHKTGPQLLKCACGEAYYCNTECQKAVWKQHKNTHKKALLLKKRGENVKQQQAQRAATHCCVESM